MQDMEAMIRVRIADHRFDDPIRMAPVPEQGGRKRQQLELNDAKSAKVAVRCCYVDAASQQSNCVATARPRNATRM
jgi:U3 small nucleolar ribonucleoprotein component